jgi:sugar diacid utilization regulator
VVAALLDSVEELTAEVLRRVWGTPGYDEEHMRPEDLASKVRPNVRWLILCLGTVGPVTEEAAASAREIGESRALQGVPIDALIQSWTTAERVVLDGLLQRASAASGGSGAAGVSGEETRRVVGRLGEVVAELTRCSVTAYRHTQEEVTAHYDRLTTDLVARLTGERPADPEAIRRHARTVGSDPTAPHAAVAIGLPAIDGPAAYLRTQRHILAVVAAASNGRILVGTLDERPLMLVPVEGATTARLTSLLEACVADRHRPDAVVLGISDQTAPLHAIGPASREAHIAMEVGLRMGWTDRAVPFSAVAPEVLLLRNPDVLAVIGQRLRPLWQRPELVETIRVYLQEGMSSRATARVLFVHPNTVQYRLRSIERILGRPLSNAVDLADVILALRGSRLG